MKPVVCVEEFGARGIKYSVDIGIDDANQCGGMNSIACQP